MISSVKRAFWTSTSTRSRSPAAVRTVAAKSTRRTVSISPDDGRAAGNGFAERSCGSACRSTTSSPRTAPTSSRAAVWSSIRYLNAASYIGLAMRIGSPYFPLRSPATPTAGA